MYYALIYSFHDLKFMWWKEKEHVHHPIKDKFSSPFENVVLGSLESFFRLDQQVDIVFYHRETTALRHSKNLPSFKTSSCTFKPINLQSIYHYEMSKKWLQVRQPTHRFQFKMLNIAKPSTRMYASKRSVTNKNPNSTHNTGATESVSKSSRHLDISQNKLCIQSTNQGRS